jgi:hypothetical protein
MRRRAVALTVCQGVSESRAGPIRSPTYTQLLTCAALLLVVAPEPLIAVMKRLRSQNVRGTAAYNRQFSMVSGDGLNGSGAEPLFRGVAWLGSAERLVTCWSGPAGYRLQVEAIGEFTVGPQGESVGWRRQENNHHQAFFETLLGPPLILSLALRGTWCLHASAVARHGRAIAFMGDSGRGKSTLAAFLADEIDGGWQRIADDILPITAGPAGVTASPHFPQLKLPLKARPSPDLPAQIPLAAIYLLERPSPEDDNQAAVRIEPLNRYRATLALIGHTVAARLFDKSLLACHTHFCADAAVPVHRLTYPHRYDLLPQIAALIAEESRD